MTDVCHSIFSQSFVDAAYPGSDSIGGFTPSGETYPHVVSASASYDSLPANLSTGQIYEVSSNDSSGLGGSVFTDTLGSSSVTSSLTGTGPDSLSDVPSRKASLSSSIHDGPLPSHPGHSPEYEDSSMLATAARWPTSSVSGVQVRKQRDEFDFFIYKRKLTFVILFRQTHLMACVIMQAVMRQTVL